jgi:pilus assembly protein CpaC
VTITYKEYGIRLNFTPTVAGDTIRLHVRPEVSTLDFPNGILLSGFRIPAPVNAPRRDRSGAARRADVCDGGSPQQLCRRTILQEIPGLARLPIIGHLVQDKSERAEQTELLVLITPQLVRPLNPDEVPPLPTLEQRFLPRPGDIGGDIQGGGGTVDGPDVTTTPPGR